MIRKLFIVAALLFSLSLGLGLQAVPQGDREDCWGTDQRCSDSKYRGPSGEEQPDKCDNFKTGDADVHDCACARAMNCASKEKTMPDCKVYCREDHCKCVKDCS